MANRKGCLNSPRVHALFLSSVFCRSIYETFEYFSILSKRFIHSEYITYYRASFKEVNSEVSFPQKDAIKEIRALKPKFAIKRN